MIVSRVAVVVQLKVAVAAEVAAATAVAFGPLAVADNFVEEENLKGKSMVVENYN